MTQVHHVVETINTCRGYTYNQLCYLVEEGEERPTCEVDGTIYKDGEAFVSKFEPEKDCYCMSGYEGIELNFFRIRLNLILSKF